MRNTYFMYRKETWVTFSIIIFHTRSQNITDYGMNGDYYENFKSIRFDENWKTESRILRHSGGHWSSLDTHQPPRIRMIFFPLWNIGTNGTRIVYWNQHGSTSIKIVFVTTHISHNDGKYPGGQAAEKQNNKN